MKVGVQRDHDTVVRGCPVQDGVVSRRPKPDVTDMDDVVPVSAEELATSTREALVEQQPHDAAERSSCWPGISVAA